MAGETDEIEGKLKHVNGDLTGHDGLERDGERDETAGKARNIFEILGN